MLRSRSRQLPDSNALLLNKDCRMKIVLLTCLSMLASAASADPQNPCNVPQPNVPAYYTDWQKGTSNVRCAPAPVGTGTLPYIRANQAGMMVWMWCPSGNTWALSRVAATWAWLSTNNVVADGAAIAASADPIAALNAGLNKNVSLPMGDPSLTPVWCPYEAQVWASKPADIVPPPPPPPAGVWLTSGLSTYSSVNGALGLFAGLGAKGRTCDCTVPIKVGTSIYCTFTGASKPSIVAACTKQ